MPLVGVGIDIVEVARVRRLLDRYADRFATRWFTPAEIRWAHWEGPPALGLSAVLAGKEAVWKSLGLSGDGPVPWRSLEVLPDAMGGQVALPPGLVERPTTFEVSISTQEHLVMAWVLATSSA